MLSFVATLLSPAAPETHVEIAVATDPAGRRELRILVGGPRLSELEAAIRTALQNAPAGCDRVAIGILPGLTQDTPACRAWRMRLQRALRAETPYGFELAVEYERWR